MNGDMVWLQGVFGGVRRYTDINQVKRVGIASSNDLSSRADVQCVEKELGGDKL